MGHPVLRTEANSSPQLEMLSTRFPKAGSKWKSSRGAHSLGREGCEERGATHYGVSSTLLGCELLWVEDKGICSLWGGSLGFLSVQRTIYASMSL